MFPLDAARPDMPHWFQGSDRRWRASGTLTMEGLTMDGETLGTIGFFTAGTAVKAWPVGILLRGTK